MQNEIKKLLNIVTRKGTNKVLSFSIPHVFKALQLLSKQKYVSRKLFCNELHIGEGAVRTLISHLKQDGFVDVIKAGTFLTPKGKILSKKFLDIIPAQRDFAIMYGAKSATTLLFENGKFVFPNETKDALEKDVKIKKSLLEKLRPQENDIIIIASSDDVIVSEISAINAMLGTLATN